MTASYYRRALAALAVHRFADVKPPPAYLSAALLDLTPSAPLRPHAA